YFVRQGGEIKICAPGESGELPTCYSANPESHKRGNAASAVTRRKIDDPAFMSSADAAKYLGIEKPQFAARVRSKIYDITMVGVSGSTRYYKKSDIERLKNGQI